MPIDLVAPENNNDDSIEVKIQLRESNCERSCCFKYICSCFFGVARVL